MDSQAHRGSRTLLWGILFGVILGVLVIFERLFEGRLARDAGLGISHPGLALLSPVILFVIGAVCFFCAGLLAARRTRQLSSGLVAGLIAGVIVGAVWLVLALHAAGVAEHAALNLRAASRLRALAQAAIGTAVVRDVLTAVLIASAGTGVGALGGLAGRGNGMQAPPSGAQSYAAGGYPPASGYTPPTPGYPAGPTPGQSPQGQYGPPTPQTYIQGNDNPTVQMLRQE